MITERILAIADDRAAIGDADGLMLLAERWARRAHRWGLTTPLGALSVDVSVAMSARGIAIYHRSRGRAGHALRAEKRSTNAAERAAKRRKR